MFSKKNWIKIRAYIGIILCAIALLASPVSTIVSYAAEPGDIELCTEYREWLYKIEDGKMYKRLYNRSTGLWETDWIYVCDYPPEE